MSHSITFGYFLIWFLGLFLGSASVFANQNCSLAFRKSDLVASSKTGIAEQNQRKEYDSSLDEEVNDDSYSSELAGETWKIWLRDIEKIRKKYGRPKGAIFTEEQIRILIEKAQSDDPYSQIARNEVIVANLPLAMMLAKRNRNFGELEDLIQTASLAVISAVDSFDLSRTYVDGKTGETKFIKFSGWVTEQFKDKLSRYRSKETKVVYVPRNVEQDIVHLKVLVDYLSRDRDRRVSANELYEFVRWARSHSDLKAYLSHDLSPLSVRSILRALDRFYSNGFTLDKIGRLLEQSQSQTLSDHVDVEGRGGVMTTFSLSDQIKNEEFGQDPAILVEKEELKEHILAAVGALTSDQVQLLDRTQGIYTEKQSRIKAGRELYQVDGSDQRSDRQILFQVDQQLKKARTGILASLGNRGAGELGATEALNQYRDYLIEAPEFSDYQHAYSEFSAGWSLSEKDNLLLYPANQDRWVRPDSSLGERSLYANVDIIGKILNVDFGWHRKKMMSKAADETDGIDAQIIPIQRVSDLEVLKQNFYNDPTPEKADYFIKSLQIEKDQQLAAKKYIEFFKELPFVIQQRPIWLNDLKMSRAVIFLLVEIYVRQGMYEEAERVLNELVQRDRPLGRDRAVVAQFYGVLCKIAEEQNERQWGFKYAQKAVQWEPKNENYLLTLSHFYNERYLLEKDLVDLLNGFVAAELARNVLSGKFEVLRLRGIKDYSVISELNQKKLRAEKIVKHFRSVWQKDAGFSLPSEDKIIKIRSGKIADRAIVKIISPLAHFIWNSRPREPYPSFTLYYLGLLHIKYGQ